MNLQQNFDLLGDFIKGYEDYTKNSNTSESRFFKNYMTAETGMSFNFITYGNEAEDNGEKKKGIFKKVWERIKHFFKSIWNAFFGKTAEQQKAETDKKIKEAEDKLKALHDKDIKLKDAEIDKLKKDVEDTAEKLQTMTKDYDLACDTANKKIAAYEEKIKNLTDISEEDKKIIDLNKSEINSLKNENELLKNENKRLETDYRKLLFRDNTPEVISNIKRRLQFNIDLRDNADRSIKKIKAKINSYEKGIDNILSKGEVKNPAVLSGLTIMSEQAKASLKLLQKSYGIATMEITDLNKTLDGLIKFSKLGAYTTAEQNELQSKARELAPEGAVESFNKLSNNFSEAVISRRKLHRSNYCKY